MAEWDVASEMAREARFFVGFTPSERAWYLGEGEHPQYWLLSTVAGSEEDGGYAGDDESDEGGEEAQREDEENEEAQMEEE